MSSESDSGEEDSDSDSEESVVETFLAFPTHILDKIFDKRQVVEDFKNSLRLKYNTKNQPKFDIQLKHLLDQITRRISLFPDSE